MLVLHCGIKILIFIIVLMDLLLFKNGIQKFSYGEAAKTALLEKTVIKTKYNFSMEPLHRS